MKLTFAKTLPALIKGCDTLLVIGPAQSLAKRKLPRALDRRLAGLLSELARDLNPGELGATASTLTGGKPRRLVLGMLPDAVSRHNTPSRAEGVRKVVAETKLGPRGKAGVLLLLDEPEHLIAAAAAVSRALPELSLKSGKQPTLRLQLLALDRDGAAVPAAPVVRETLAAARDAAELVDTPPSVLTPEALAERAREMLAGAEGVEGRVIVGDDLLGEGLGAIHAVGRAATSAPRLFLAQYTPPDEGGCHVALVGKGVTYDTGGLHLKRVGFMEGMKCDMGGAAAVLGAFRVLARTGCPHRVSLLLCLAENAIGPLSYKPDDVITSHSGKTIEINNTDAEGRLLLADGVSYAARVLGADHVIDAATLTGAQLVATGVLHAAIVSNDERLERIAVEAGRLSGDLTHPLPFVPEFFRQEFKSEVADMRNSVKNRMNAQSSCAAQFVFNHLEGTGVSWLHVDLAGPAFPSDRGSGYGVALLAEVVRRIG